jgi:hypothetical protein
MTDSHKRRQRRHLSLESLKPLEPNMRLIGVPAVLLSLTVSAGPLSAQATPGAAPAADSASPLGVFAHLTGEWEGTAWMVRGPGARHEVRQQEWVQVHAGGTVVAVKGVGTATTEPGDAQVVHDAFAIIHLDRDGRTPRMRAFVAGGYWLDVELTVQPDGYDWAMTDPRAGSIRYEMRIDDASRWVERGYVSRDQGATWSQFMEMTLTRVRQEPSPH